MMTASNLRNDAKHKGRMGNIPPPVVVENKRQVVNCLQDHSNELQGFGVVQCGLFGSFVKDKAIHDQSDVDILVAFDPGKKRLITLWDCHSSWRNYLVDQSIWSLLNR